MQPPRILMVVTSTSTLGQTGQPTGFWFEEMAVPFMAFANAGYVVDLASIKGGKAPIDPKSLEGSMQQQAMTFQQKREYMSMLESTKRLMDIDLTLYAGAFFVGGHGTMWDFPTSSDCKKVVESLWNSGRVIGAICHGSAALLGATDARTGKPVFNNKRISCFTDSEERAVGKDKNMPFMLESRIRDMGGRIERGADNTAFAVRDGILVTGQNPMSADRTAQLMLEALREKTQNA